MDIKRKRTYIAGIILVILSPIIYFFAESDTLRGFAAGLGFSSVLILIGNYFNVLKYR